MVEQHAPQFTGQRPPFAAGNAAALVHGANSPARVDPLAAQIEQHARSSQAWPAYLNDPAYGSAVTAWARAEAVVELLWTHLAGRDITEALTEVGEQEAEEIRTKGRSKSASSSRRTTAALAAWHKAESAAANHRSRLGLDPLSRARLGKDVAITAVQAGLVELQNSGAQLVASARAAGALTDSTPDPAYDRSDQLSGRHDADEATDD